MSVVIGSVPRGFCDDIKNTLLIPMPPRNGGGWNWGDSYLSFGADFGPARLRIAVWNDTGAYWRVEELIVPSEGGRAHVVLQDGDSKVSVGRLKYDDNDTGQNPVGYLFEIILKA